MDVQLVSFVYSKQPRINFKLKSFIFIKCIRSSIYRMPTIGEKYYVYILTRMTAIFYSKHLPICSPAHYVLKPPQSQDWVSGKILMR